MFQSLTRSKYLRDNYNRSALLLFRLLSAASWIQMSCRAFTIPSDRHHVVVVGSANQDLTAYTPVLPTMGETVMGGDFETSEGGKGANQAVAAGSLGICPVTMICRVGNDVFGESILRKLSSVNVVWEQERAILKGPNSPSSGTATIVVDTNSGDNMIIVTPGANYELTAEQVDESLRSLERKPSIVVVQLEIKPKAALQALKTAKDLGAVTILNPAPAPDGYTLDEFFPYCDVIIPNETELRKVLGRPEDDPEDEVVMAKELLGKGPDVAIVTLGARGAMVVAQGEDTEPTVALVDAPEDLPARSEPVQDTVGAGDAFCGALSSYLSVGVPLNEAAALACGFASMSVRRRGASYPTASELPDCLLVDPSMSAINTAKPTLTLVTGNPNKLEEVKQILSTGDETLPFTLANRKLDLPELQGSDPVAIAKEKCKLAADEIQGPCLTEDTSLCFNALNGMPGPYIKWFLENCGHDGLNRMLDGFDDRTAYAQTVFAFTTGPGKEVHVFEGRTDGNIVPARGPTDFGWDPIFEPLEGGGQTYAEMTKAAKNSISHRGRSLANLQGFFRENPDFLSNA